MIGARRIGTLLQTDTYFKIGRGRLKLREFASGQAELIYYKRPNSRASRYSDYEVIPVKEPAALRRLFDELFGTRVVIRKERLLFLHRNSRIHIDKVSGLGSFVEFEVLVTKGKAQDRQLMDKLKEAFGVRPENILGESYSDMLLKRQRSLHRRKIR